MMVDINESFSTDGEVALVTFAQDNYIATGLIFTDSDLYEIAMNAFLLKYQKSRSEMLMFQCSARFITNFKRRHCLTFRRVHFKRRSPVTVNQPQTSLATVRELPQNVPWNRVINCDEISQLLHADGILTRAEVGAESVQRKSTGNEKENITVVTSVTAARDILSL
jgi:hypothetical protein